MAEAGDTKLCMFEHERFPASQFKQVGNTWVHLVDPPHTLSGEEVEVGQETTHGEIPGAPLRIAARLIPGSSGETGEAGAAEGNAGT